MIRQGDVLLIPRATVPLRHELVDPVIAGGEASSHAHRLIGVVRASLDAESLALFATLPGLARDWPLVLVGADGAMLVHEEHDAILVPPGVHEVRRQRQHGMERYPWAGD